MKVLIVECDLFGAVGGGQAFYRSAILRNPHVQFYYLRLAEHAGTDLPPNVHPLPFAQELTTADLNGFVDPGPPLCAWYQFVRANNIAASARGHRFDVIDVPDYEGAGVFLRAALRHHGVPFGRLALSMHGPVSLAFDLNWGSPPGAGAGIRRLEGLQYAGADLRYFISPMYREQWAAASPLPSELLDPLYIFAAPPRLPYTSSAGAPTVNFIARTERAKGPHLFLQLLWWLGRSKYSAARVIGPHCQDLSGASSLTHLRAVAANRRLDVEFVDALPRAALAREFATRAVTVVPSLADTLNFVALESLFSGCPTVISSAAGAAHYLPRRFPELPFVLLDLRDFFPSVLRVERLLADYDAERERLGRALARIDMAPSGPQLEAIYSAPVAHDAGARRLADGWFASFLNHVRPADELAQPAQAA